MKKLIHTLLAWAGQCQCKKLTDQLAKAVEVNTKAIALNSRILLQNDALLKKAHYLEDRLRVKDAELTVTAAERDRYRKALVEISLERHQGNGVHMQGTAIQALEGK